MLNHPQGTEFERDRNRSLDEAGVTAGSRTAAGTVAALTGVPKSVPGYSVGALQSPIDKAGTPSNDGRFRDYAPSDDRSR
jgi:hypothetical protein